MDGPIGPMLRYRCRYKLKSMSGDKAAASPDTRPINGVSTDSSHVTPATWTLARTMPNSGS